jgi:acetyl-CoA C-acetyltransferase
MSDRVAVIGVGWAGYRPVTPEVSYKELMYEAAIKAYDDAGIDPRKDVDSFITVAEDFIEGTSIFDEYVPDQLGAVLKPVHTIGGDGLHGIATAVMLIKTGQADIVVVEGHSKASNVLTLPHIVAYAQDPILNRPLNWETDFVAGLEMNRYLYESGISLEQCAMVVMKNRRNALRNPLAAHGADLTLDEAMGGDPIAWPLLDRHAARYADGAIVLVLASEKVSENLSPHPVWVTGVGWCNGSASLESREWGYLPYIQSAADMAYSQAGIGQPNLDLDFVEIDDIYAYKELQTLNFRGARDL